MSEQTIHRTSLSGTNITVVGAGTMGHGIAIPFAITGASVQLFDVDERQLTTALKKIESVTATLARHSEHPLTRTEARDVPDRIDTTTDLDTAVEASDHVFEAVPEDLETKRKVLVQIEEAAPDDAILATNTSSLSVTTIGTVLSKPGRYLGTHWFSPPYIVPVVEVVRATDTESETVSKTSELLATAGKTPVTVNRDIPGFIGNRIQSAMANEAWALLEADVATAEDIDRAVKGTFGFRLPILGVFEKGDHSGLNIHHKVLDELLDEIDRSTDPPEILSALVASGRHGLKSGEGVYDWSETDRETITQRRDEMLLSQLALYRRALESKENWSEEPT